MIWDWRDECWTRDDRDDMEPPEAPREPWEYAWDEEPEDDGYPMAMWDPVEGWIDAP